MTDPWKEAIIDACIINHLDWDENDPKGTLNKVIWRELQMFTDPSITAPPRGWKMVPIDVTKEMLEAVEARGGPQARAFAYAAWDDLLRAVPQPPKKTE